MFVALLLSSDSWKVCELGCGPGLPSLAAASKGCPLVVATDVDKFALELVQAASREQGFDKQLITDQLDLTQNPSHIINKFPWTQQIDLFVMADVFENSMVARGAADLTIEILNSSDSRVWVFAQSDRAQRESYLEIIQKCFPNARWSKLEDNDPRTSKLLLIDLDETTVNYG